MRGVAYGVGLGPGDPELVTIKAARLIGEVDVVAVPGSKPEKSRAFAIACSAVPSVMDKRVVALPAPMVHDCAKVMDVQRKNAHVLESLLDQGLDVAFLTLGDPTLYCTFSHIQRVLAWDGYTVELVNGVASFCAAAARLGIPLVEWDEPLHVVPVVHGTEGLDLLGTQVLMKPGGRLGEVAQHLAESGRDVWAVENCGMQDERVYRGAEQIPNEAGYLTLAIAK